MFAIVHLRLPCKYKMQVKNNQIQSDQIQYIVVGTAQITNPYSKKCMHIQYCMYIVYIVAILAVWH